MHLLRHEIVETHRLVGLSRDMAHCGSSKVLDPEVTAGAHELLNDLHVAVFARKVETCELILISLGIHP